MSQRSPGLATALLLLTLMPLLGACSGDSDAAAQKGGAQKGGARGPTQVGFITVATSSVPVINQLGGRTVAYETSEVRPQVNGLVQRRLFTEGSFDIGGQAYVFLVGPGNKAVRRQVRADQTQGTDWVITGGLKAGDKVISQGLANLRDGAAIRPVLAGTPQRIAPPPAGVGQGEGQGQGQGQGQNKGQAKGGGPA